MQMETCACTCTLGFDMVGGALIVERRVLHWTVALASSPQSFLSLSCSRGAFNTTAEH
jgi:hypothetical protein